MKTRFLSKEQMEKLTTKRLLAYKNRLMKVVEGPSYDDDPDALVGKKDPEWKEIIKLIKSILKTREHVK